MASTCILVFTVVLANLVAVHGHGTVMSPVQRGSAWRQGFKTPQNFNDMSNFCAGFAVQYGKENGGKCGLCGDNYAQKQPRDHENGGEYGTGTIVKTYHAGETIKVDVHLTAAHAGHFEFSICPLKNETELETEECFDAHKLKLASGEDKFTAITTPKMYHIDVVLPKDVTCEHCVFRWHYRAGNNWGWCPNGKNEPGCGDQETFRTCSDIKIVDPATNEISHDE